ncbi:MAG TPA: SDR family oxidoreductase, partial [Polyangiaceae bacterium]
MKLRGRSAIITGGSQGLGRAIADAFVSEGADVLLCARGADALEQTCRELSVRTQDGQRVLSLAADVSQRAAAEQLAAHAVQTFGHLDILVNNAGVYGPMGCIEEVDWDQWTRAVEINLMGTVLPCRAVLPHFKRRGYGKIINLSGGGATAPLPRISAYAASKAAVVRFTETLAEEVRANQIDVNAMAPGGLDTRLLDEVLASGPEKVGEEFYRKSLQLKEGKATPLETGAGLAVFLASP